MDAGGALSAQLRRLPRMDSSRTNRFRKSRYSWRAEKIKAYYHYYAGDPDLLAKASIFSALQLYLDFLNLFVRLLSILGKRRS